MVEKGMAGQYSDWLSSLNVEPGQLSFRRSDFSDVTVWREKARERVNELLARPTLGNTPTATTEAVYEYDGLHIEELQWKLPYGSPTKAMFLRPIDVEKELPGVIGLHDHGGFKYFGHRKIVETDRVNHELMREHREEHYGGNPWANELAKRGYGVLVHDGFAFGSRRIDVEKVPPLVRRNTPKPSDDDRESIKEYDTWAAKHESTLAKSIFAAGTTWPGVFLTEDMIAVDILADREDVDQSRIGCCGLSGGGLRTVFLGGIDERIKSATCVGMMTTWADYVVNKSAQHTWMCFLPRCAQVVDYPEILGLRCPNPTLVLNNREDPLFTREHMDEADRVLEQVYEKAGARNNYRCQFYDGPHKFDTEMQGDAFEWFDRTIGSA
jgi:dienelactone hydrolase